MAKRKTISKTVRFEVFKRDKFTCQYCGAKAPEVVLHLDHIHPHSKGGSDDILNLLTACQNCNGGKGARKLDDASEMEKQHRQMAELQERRDQLQMMMKWRQGLEDETKDKVDIVSKAVAHIGQLGPNENGRMHIRKWLKKWPLDLVLSGVTESFETYVKFADDKVCQDSWNLAFNKVPGVIGIISQAKEKPYLKRLFYIQGICRIRFKNKNIRIVGLLEECVVASASLESIEACAKASPNLCTFESQLNEFIKSQRVSA